MEKSAGANGTIGPKCAFGNMPSKLGYAKTSATATAKPIPMPLL